jgi:hypothetical protein
MIRERAVRYLRSIRPAPAGFRPSGSWPLAAVALVCLAALAGCAAAPDAASGADLAGQARAEATRILQQAQATAIVLEAQTTAAAMTGRLAAPAPTPVSTLVPAAASPASAAAFSPTPAAARANAGPTPLVGVEIVNVTFGAEGALIAVNFRAPVAIARSWTQGNVSITDEGSGTSYNFVAVAPILGPLIGHPAREGQLGYVMLVNGPPPLRPGALVTVVLGSFRQEHVVAR